MQHIEGLFSAMMPDGKTWQSILARPINAPKPNYGVFFLSDTSEWCLTQIADTQEKANKIANQWQLHEGRNFYSIPLLVRA